MPCDNGVTQAARVAPSGTPLVTPSRPGAARQSLVLVTLLIPVSAVLLGHTILGEAVRPQHFAGMALIALGLAAIDGRAVTALRQWRVASRPGARPRES